MKNFYFTPAALAMVALLAACGSTPKSTSLLDQAHSDYRIAQNNPNVAKYAPLELKQAGDAMAQAAHHAANTRFSFNPMVDAYVRHYQALHAASA